MKIYDLRYIELKRNRVHGNCSWRQRGYMNAILIDTSLYENLICFRGKKTIKEQRQWNMEMAVINRCEKRYQQLQPKASIAEKRRFKNRV